MDIVKFVLPLPIPSKKNSKLWTGKYLLSSDKYRQWESDILKRLPILCPAKFGKCRMSFYFYPENKRRFDMSNKQESIQDLLVKGGVLQDDSIFYLNGYTAELISIDKKNPRVEIIIERS